MQDLTTGSVTRHLLKTASFMLVTMVFQTLYFLVDLYWVGRLGKEAVAGGRHRRQPHVHRARDLADARRRHDDAGLARRRAARSTRAALLVFNQSQVLSVLVGVIFLVVAMAAARLRTRRRWAPTPQTARAGRRVPALVHPGDGAAVRDGRDGRGAARHRQLQAGHDRRRPRRSSSTWCWRRS